jgi:hypothetical protein
MPSPPLAKAKSKTTPAKSKKARYPNLRPVPLASELALAQLVDGGSMETNIHRFNKAHAKAVACSGQSTGVGDVYRDGKGGIWLDQDEEWEYAGLLDGDDDAEDTPWVDFGGSQSGNVGIDLAGEERRASMLSQDSDLRFMHPVQQQDDLAAWGGSLAPIILRKPNVSVLTVPSRPKRNANHLHKPEFILDGTFAMPRKKGHKRPAPLALTPPGSLTKRPSNSPVDMIQVRKDFLDGSFEPEPAAESVGRSSTSSTSTIQTRRRSSTVSVLRSTMTNSPSQASTPRRGLNMKGIFKSVGGTKRDAK